MLPELIIQK